jgi:hypothetical protein
MSDPLFYLFFLILPFTALAIWILHAVTLIRGSRNLARVTFWLLIAGLPLLAASMFVLFCTLEPYEPVLKSIQPTNTPPDTASWHRNRQLYVFIWQSEALLLWFVIGFLEILLVTCLKTRHLTRRGREQRLAKMT